MRRTILLLVVAMTFPGCESDQERQIREMEKHVNATLRMNWREDLPLDDLYIAHGECRLHPKISACDQLQWQLQDVADTFASCKQDQRSALCQVIVRDISKHKLVQVLPNAESVRLPDTPWYWQMPTAALDAQAGKFNYRSETVLWWWEAWRRTLTFCLALFAGIAGGWEAWVYWLSKKHAQAEEAAHRRAAFADELKKEARVRAAAERLAQEEHEAELAEQRRIASQKEAEQQAAVAAARQAAVQIETDSMIHAAFASKKSKRRTDAAASQ